MAPRKTNREAEMLVQARRLFSQRGYGDTSLEEVAQVLGVTRQAFYHYFKSKEDLLWRIVGELGDQLLDRALPIANSERPALERIQLIMSAHAQALLDDREAFLIYLMDRQKIGKANRREVQSGEYKYTELIADVIEAGQRDGTIRAAPPRVLALLLTGQANSILRWYRPRGEMTAAELAKLVSDMAVGSLRAD
jgi:TetR/AcrR family transcriptional regulator, cholesterol catabolism regulator